MAATDVLFTQPDVNYDEQLILNEYRKILDTGKTSYGRTRYGVTDGFRRVGAGGSYGLPLKMGTNYRSDLVYTGAGLGGVNYNASSLYGSSVGNGGGDLAIVGGTVGLAGADLAATNYLSTSQATGFQQYQTDAQGLYQDPNPKIIRRPAPGGGVTYKQNIGVRYLRPPPVPAPGPLIIKEVRPPQPPPPPPLRIRQQAPPHRPPPPLILLERPSTPPAPVPTQTFIRRLAPLPVPPRSVVVEREAPSPPKPKNVILERWLPYGAPAKRRTIVQRAPPVKPYSNPRNVVIQYESTPVNIVRKVQFLGVTQEDPQAYIQRYGASLLDSHTLEQIARAAGVVENISPSVLGGSVAANSIQFASSTGTLGYDAGEVDFNSSSPYQWSSYSADTDLGGVSLDDSYDYGLSQDDFWATGY
ncbi:unnamed protein product [Rotaria sp. Silwood2]|nr:unnamed protein product [Rotaria sp. Silwood2]